MLDEFVQLINNHPKGSRKVFIGNYKSVRVADFPTRINNSIGLNFVSLLKIYKLEFNNPWLPKIPTNNILLIMFFYQQDLWAPPPVELGYVTYSVRCPKIVRGSNSAHQEMSIEHSTSSTHPRFLYRVVYALFTPCNITVGIKSFTQ